MSKGPRPEEFIAAYLARASRGAELVLEYGAGAVSYAAYIPARLIRTDLTAAPKDGLDRGLETVCDLKALPFRDRSVDLIFGVAVLIYLDDLKAAMTECARVLKPGGRLAVFEYHRLINLYNQLRGQGYAQTLGLKRLGRALEGAGLSWVRRPEVAPSGSRGRWPDWMARRRWLMVEARLPRGGGPG